MISPIMLLPWRYIRSQCKVPASSGFHVNSRKLRDRHSKQFRSRVVNINTINLYDSIQNHVQSRLVKVYKVQNNFILSEACSRNPEVYRLPRMY